MEAELKHYLYLEPYVSVFSSTKEYLFYNTLNGSLIESLYYQELLPIFEKLTDSRNMYFVELDESEKSNMTNTFVEELRGKFMGDILNILPNSNKPVQLFPLLNFQKDETRFKEGYFSSIGDDVMHYLKEMTLFINSYFENINEIPSVYKNQFHFPTLDNRNDILSLNDIREIVEQTKICDIENLNILGGDILLHTEIEEIVSFLNDCNFLKTFHFYCNEKNLQQKINLVLGNRINIYIDSDIGINELAIIKNASGQDSLSFTFILTNEEDYNFFEKIITENSFENYILKPFFNGENESFFKENVFVTKEDLFEVVHEQNDIFAKSKINLNNFGKLIILNNGDVLANINGKPLGNIYVISIKDAVYKELQSKESWRLTKNEVEVCKDCIYNQLCPSISNYEYALGRFNLCSIREN
jgi:pseudo-rSAM protein